MVLMWVLAVLIAAGFLMAFRWAGEGIKSPWAGTPASSDIEALKRYAWYLTIALGAGIVSGVVMIGAGGRLAMRLLAAAAGDTAQGRITEADEIVGTVTIDGSLGFVLFFGLLGGLASGIAFMLIQRWLPGGHWKGFMYGVMLLVLGATRVDPLRPENSDFDIVGPGWLAIAMFVAIALGHGMLLAAMAGRYSRALPVLSSDWRKLAYYAPLLLLIVAFPILALVVAGAIVALLVRRVRALQLPVSHPKSLFGGRALGVVAALIALPGFLSALADIAGRP